MGILCQLYDAKALSVKLVSKLDIEQKFGMDMLLNGGVLIALHCVKEMT